VRPILNLASPIAGGVPIAGTPLKASIDALLVVLNGINKRAKNKENAVRLKERLSRLDAAIVAIPPANHFAQYQRRELARKLDAVSERLKQLDVKSVFGSADIEQAILDCIREIGEHELDHVVLSIMRMECSLKGVSAILDHLEESPRAVKQEMVSITDATGPNFTLLASQCQLRQQMMGILEWCFKYDNRDRVLRNFIARGAYDLYIETNSGTSHLDESSRVRAGMRIIMSAIFEQSRESGQYKCPRPQCGKWNDCQEASDGWVNCVGCPGRFQVTNADSRSGGKNMKFRQKGQDSTTRSANDDYNLDLIQIFHLKQQFEFFFCIDKSSIEESVLC